MKLVQLDTGYANPPYIDIDRVMFCQSYEGSGINGGYVDILFFGSGEKTRIHFMSEQLAEKAVRNIYLLLNGQTVTDALEDLQIKKEQNKP